MTRGNSQTRADQPKFVVRACMLMWLSRRPVLYATHTNALKGKGRRRNFGGTEVETIMGSTKRNLLVPPSLPSKFVLHTANLLARGLIDFRLQHSSPALPGIALLKGTYKYVAFIVMINMTSTGDIFIFEQYPRIIKSASLMANPSTVTHASIYLADYRIGG